VVLGLAVWQVRPVSAEDPPAGPAAPALPAPNRVPRTPARDLISSSGRKAAPADVPAPNGAIIPEMPALPPGLPLIPQPFFTTEAAQYMTQVPGPDNILEVIVGHIQIFNLKIAPSRLQVGDETVANYVLLGTTELSLQGLRVGTTVLNVWFPEEGKKQSKLVSFKVRVLPDPDARARLERAYRNLENEINRVFPNSRVHLTLVGDKLAVTGQARDIAEANFIMRMVQANVLPEAADSPDLGRPPSADPANYYRNIPPYHRQVVNMMRVVGEQQVALQVQVVEVDRAAARSIGLDFAIFRHNGALVVAGTTANLAQNQGGVGFARFGGLSGSTALGGVGSLANLPIALDNGQIQLAISALRSLSYARYLAEPNLVAINGQTANFQVGSLLPVPVVTGTAGLNNLQGVNFIPTGVQLAFTPYITDRDRVRLSINAEVSDRDLNTAPTIIDGAAIPSLVTRNFQTTVELREGQTLAVAGLIETKLNTLSNRLPFLAQIPVINRIAGFDQIGNTEKELVILVTPRLVRPLDCKELPPLPGQDVLEPNDLEFYLLGRLESHTGMDYRSPVRTDCSRTKQYREVERNMLIGPSGPSVDLPLASEVPAAPPSGVPVQVHPSDNGPAPAPPRAANPTQIPVPPLPVPSNPSAAEPPG
jgi:pilus assembly protein CpaC